jgi:hypothetical protein
LKQIPFNGKKLKPSKLRKDFWRPLAMIQFPEGQGEVGQSVFQRLRECKKYHELSWDDSYLYGDGGKLLTRLERGAKLNNQKSNTIADMAAVLGGIGKGNKIWVKPTAEEVLDMEKEPATSEATEGEAETIDAGLVNATIWWANETDRNFASSWSPNVTHQLFDQATIQPVQVVDEGATTAQGDNTAESAPADVVAQQELLKDTKQDHRPAP